MYWVFTFPTTHLALKFDRAARKEKRKAKLIPLPRKIGASCGFCGKVADQDEVEKLIEMCEKHGIEFEHIYRVPEDNREEPTIYM